MTTSMALSMNPKTRQALYAGPLRAEPAASVQRVVQTLADDFDAIPATTQRAIIEVLESRCAPS